MFNVVIIGGEFTENYDFFQERCVYFLREKAKSGEKIKIFTIGDSYVDKFANRFGINTKTFSCDWTLYGKNAIKQRNRELFKDANALIFFDSSRKDLTYVLNYAKALNIPVRVIKTN